MGWTPPLKPPMEWTGFAEIRHSRIRPEKRFLLRPGEQPGLLCGLYDCSGNAGLKSKPSVR